MANEIRGPLRQLFQSRPLSTSALTVWSNGFFGQYKIPLITICNVSAVSPVTVTLYHDEDGQSYTDDTVVIAPVTLQPGDTLDVEREGFGGYKDSATVGVKVSAAGLATITGYGSRSDEKVTP